MGLALLLTALPVGFVGAAYISRRIDGMIRDTVGPVNEIIEVAVDRETRATIALNRRGYR